MAKCGRPVSFSGLACVVKCVMRRLTIILVVLIAMAGGVYIGARYAHRDPLGSGPRLRVTFLRADLGGGVLVETAAHSYTLIDPGPAGTVEDLCSYLVSRSCESITVVITNDSPRRADALETLRQRFSVKRIVRGEVTDSSPEFTKLVREIAATGVPDIVMTAGDEVQLPGGAEITACGPPAKLYPGLENSFEDNSLVLFVKFGKKKFLLPSDIGSAAQNRLIHSGQRITADVMQTPKFGGRGALSLEFLARVRPAHIVFTSGRPLGLPSRRVVERVEPANSGAILHRTDRSGNIDAITDGTLIIFRNEVK